MLYPTPCCISSHVSFSFDYIICSIHVKLHYKSFQLIGILDCLSFMKVSWNWSLAIMSSSQTNVCIYRWQFPTLILFYHLNNGRKNYLQIQIELLEYFQIETTRLIHIICTLIYKFFMFQAIMHWHWKIQGICLGSFHAKPIFDQMKFLKPSKKGLQVFQDLILHSQISSSNHFYVVPTDKAASEILHDTCGGSEKGNDGQWDG